MKYFQPTTLEVRPPQRSIADQLEPIVVNARFIDEDTATPPPPPPQTPSEQPRQEEEQGWRHWVTYAIGPAKWGFVIMLIVIVILLSLSRNGGKEENDTASTAEGSTFTVIAGTKPTEPIEVPLGSGLRWESTRPGAKFEVISDKDIKTEFPSEKYEKLPDGDYVRFRSLETEPVSIRVRVVPLGN